MPALLTEHDFNTLFETYWEELYQAAYLRTKDAALTEDILQEVFLSLWQRRSSLTINTSLRSYLLTAVKYQVFNHYKKEMLLSYPIPEDMAEEVEHPSSFDRLYPLIEEAMEHLSPRCRQVFTLHKLEGMPVQAIAEKLQVAPQTIHNQLSSAMKTIRKHLPANSLLSFLF